MDLTEFDERLCFDYLAERTHDRRILQPHAQESPARAADQLRHIESDLQAVQQGCRDLQEIVSYRKDVANGAAGVHADATNADIIARSIDERDVTNVRRLDDYGNLVLLSPTQARLRTARERAEYVHRTHTHLTHAPHRRQAAAQQQDPHPPPRPWEQSALDRLRLKTLEEDMRRAKMRLRYWGLKLANIDLLSETERKTRIDSVNRRFRSAFIQMWRSKDRPVEGNKKSDHASKLRNAEPTPGRWTDKETSARFYFPTASRPRGGSVRSCEEPDEMPNASRPRSGSVRSYKSLPSCLHHEEENSHEEEGIHVDEGIHEEPDSASDVSDASLVTPETPYALPTVADQCTSSEPVDLDLPPSADDSA